MVAKLRQILFSTLVIVLATLVANFITLRWNEYARDTRTAKETEVHHVLDNPYVHLGNHKPNNQIRQGQVYYVNNKYIKSETCHVFVTNLLINKTTRVAHHYSMFINWFNAGRYEADEYFEMPENLPPGHYNLIKKTVSFCNGYEHYSTNYDLELDVLPKL